MKSIEKNNQELEKMILDMAYQEIQGYTSSKGSEKLLKSNLEKIIENHIYYFDSYSKNTKKYMAFLKKCSYNKSVVEISKLIKKEQFFRTRKDLYSFAKYLNLEIKDKISYKQLIRQISNHIYSNKKFFSQKYFLINRGNNEYILEPEIIKEDLVNSYKSKTRNDMKNLAKLLNVDTDSENDAEDIRVKIINSIVRSKLGL